MRHFKSIDKIKNATVDELTAVEGMNIGSARKVFEFFAGNNEQEKNDK